MTYYEDLSLYSYDESIEGKVLLNIGWLERNIPFKTGATPKGFIERLGLSASTKVNLTRGTHYCPICPEHSYQDHSYWSKLLNENIWLGMSEIDIFAEDDVIYIAPSLIIHYIQAHNYLPPQRYIDAVMKISIDEYLEIAKGTPYGQPRVELYR